MRQFVKLRTAPTSGTQREHAAAARELSTTGVYKVAAQETDAGEEFVLLVGGMSYHSAKLFEVVQ